ncbi:NAD kinase 2, mitochondrial [Caenorhabditis elegans]|nr:NAD kinase 2, mitochondrial [Caenorhabditis elegans]CAA19455.2 NAD kinase 2, mitochondrial [Caenorhabditis elegans]|eukprot:NP_496565.2 NAD kinase 2, mitochondrial [Caenorhabditis elegans]
MRLPRSLAAALYQTQNTQSKRSIGNMEKPSFTPKKVLILSKLTRYEFEKRVNKGCSDEQLATLLKKRGSDYGRLLSKHKIHHSYLNTLQRELENAGIESRLVRRFGYTQEAVDWADAVFSAGGDGTFLMASSRVRTKHKPVIGINTDPQGSEGYMCLMRKLPEENLAGALKKLFSGNFEWLNRQRIRITVTGDDGISDAIELHDQQLNRDPATTRWTDNPRSPAREIEECMSLSPPVKKRMISEAVEIPEVEKETVELPVLALNEVFIGESLSSRVSYYEIGINDAQMLKQKSSGITICTGTGSTSWNFNINKLTEQCVQDLMKIVAEHCNLPQIPHGDKNAVSEICTKFNQQLIFDPDRKQLAFSVRDPIFNATFPPTDPRGFADKICIKSRGYDAHLVIDGGISYRFNDGSEAVMEVRDEDTLRTVVFR